MRRAVLLAIAPLAAACRGAPAPRVLAGETRLGMAPTVLRPAPPLRVTPGARHELCLIFAKRDAAEVSPAPEHLDRAVGSPVRTPEGRVVRFAATFLGGDGVSEAVTPQGWLTSRDSTQVCLFPHRESGEIVQVSLEADGPVRVARVTWFDGVHRLVAP